MGRNVILYPGIRKGLQEDKRHGVEFSSFLFASLPYNKVIVFCCIMLYGDKNSIIYVVPEKYCQMQRIWQFKISHYCHKMNPFICVNYLIKSVYFIFKY